MAQVTGLHWGDYVGSPDLSAPVITWSSDRKHTAVKLATLSTGETFGLDPSSTLLFRETGDYTLLTADAEPGFWDQLLILFFVFYASCWDDAVQKT